jgi:hypothetical protein
MASRRSSVIGFFSAWRPFGDNVNRSVSIGHTSILLSVSLFAEPRSRFAMRIAIGWHGYSYEWKSTDIACCRRPRRQINGISISADSGPG